MPIIEKLTREVYLSANETDAVDRVSKERKGFREEQDSREQKGFREGQDSREQKGFREGQDSRGQKGFREEQDSREQKGHRGDKVSRKQKGSGEEDSREQESSTDKKGSGKKQKSGVEGKKEKAPEYVTTLLGAPAINYHVYYRSKKDKIFNFLLMMACGGVVGYVFFGNLALDAYGRKTALTHILNIAIPVVLGLILTVIYAPVQENNLKRKRDAMLRNQFRDLLDCLVNSLTSGKNVQGAFQDALVDLRMQHSDKAYIVKEVQLMISGMKSNIGIENLLIDFGQRSGIEDITNFGITFQTCFRKGGNIKQVVIKTNEIISGKMQMEEDLRTKIHSNVNEQYLMLVMPVFIVAVVKMGNATMAANYASPVGIVTSIVCLGIFVGAYLIGCKLVEVKI